MLLVNARLTFILRDVLYTCLPNDLAVFAIGSNSAISIDSWQT